MIELPPGKRNVLDTIFADYPYLRGFVPAVLAGGMGDAFADDMDNPKVGCLHLSRFYLLAGEADSDAAIEMVGEIPRESVLVGANANWEGRIRQVWGDNLDSWTRVAFGPGRWDRARLQTFARDLPAGYVIKPVTDAEVEGFAKLADWLISNYPTHNAFLAQGFGFAIEYAGKVVAGCGSFAVGGGKIDCGIATLPNFRRRGLATAVAAAMILHCLEHDIDPCWDAANEISAGLAEKLGFTNPTPYNAYTLR